MPVGRLQPAPAFFAAPPPSPAPAAAMAAIPADWDPFAPEMPTSGVTLGRIISTPSDPLGLGAPEIQSMISFDAEFGPLVPK